MSRFIASALFMVAACCGVAFAAVTTRQLNIAVLVIDPVRPAGSILAQNYTISPTLQAAVPLYGTQQRILNGIYLWRDVVISRGGITTYRGGESAVLIPNITFIALGSANQSDAVLTASGRTIINNLIRNTTTVAYPNVPVAIIVNPGTSIGQHIAWFGRCEATKQCTIFNPFLFSESAYVCSNPLPAECIANARQAGQRRFDYGFSAVSSGYNILASWLSVYRGLGVKKLAIVASSQALAPTMVAGTIANAQSLAMSVDFQARYPLAGISIDQAGVILRNITENYPAIDAVVVIGSTAPGDALTCQAFVRAMRNNNIAPRAIAFAGGCGGVLFGDAVILENNLQKYTTGAVPYDPRARGQEFRSNSAIGSLEPFEATETTDSSQVYADMYAARFGVSAQYAIPALSTLACLMIQKSIEATSSVLDPAPADIVAGSVRVSQSSFFGHLQFDTFGRMNDAPYLAYQALDSTYVQMLTPLSIGVPPIFPTPTWDEREYKLEFFTESPEKALIAIASVANFYAFVILLLIVWYWKHPVVKASSPFFCCCTIAGAMALISTVYVWTLEEDDTTCSAKIWMMQLGFTTMFGSMLVKTVRIWFIFSIKKLQVVRIANRDLLLAMLLLVGVDSAFTGAWQGISGFPSSVVSVDPYRPSKNYSTCHIDSTSYSFVIAALCIKFGLMLIAALFAFRTRKVHDDFNESNYIGATVWNITFLMLIGVAVVATSSDRIFSFYVRAIGLILLGTTSVSFLFIPKLLIIWGSLQVKLDGTNNTVPANGSVVNAPGGSVESNQVVEFASGPLAVSGVTGANAGIASFKQRQAAGQLQEKEKRIAELERWLSQARERLARYEQLPPLQPITPDSNGAIALTLPVPTSGGAAKPANVSPGRKSVPGYTFAVQQPSPKPVAATTTVVPIGAAASTSPLVETAALSVVTANPPAAAAPVASSDMIAVPSASSVVSDVSQALPGAASS